MTLNHENTVQEIQIKNNQHGQANAVSQNMQSMSKHIPVHAQTKLHLVQGHKFLLLDSPDMISAHLRSGKLWEPLLLQYMQQFLSIIAQPVLLDIGANLGAISIPMAKWLQPLNGQVISFEPQRQVYYQLCANIFANQLVRCCTAYHLAVGHQNAQVDLPILDYATEHNVGSLSLITHIRELQNTLSTKIHEFESVKLVTLDSLDLPKAHAIKIDVEGLELEVLQGAQSYIQSSAYPVLFFEVWGDYLKEMIPKRTELLKFVTQDLGYEIFQHRELCIAQHPCNKTFEILRANNSSQGLTLRRL